MESPSKPGANLYKRSFPYHRLALKNVRRGHTGWSENLCSQYRQQQLRSIRESRRHDVRLTDPAMTIVFEIPVEGTENVGPLEPATSLTRVPPLFGEPRSRFRVAS